MHRIGNKIKTDVYQRWLRKNSAQRLMALEAGWLKDSLHHLHGLHLAYCGIDQAPRFLEAGRCGHRFRLGLPWQKGLIQAEAWMQEDAWPLADESVDIVVLQHSLDMSRRPHQLIREACRTLVPNGYLVLTGFNPYSPWGGARWLNTFSPELPWVANPVQAARLQDWLVLLDFRVESIQHVAHLWPLPFFSERLARRIDRVAANKRWVPGNGYILIARKTVAGVTPIRERRWFNRSAGFAMPIAATRNAINKTSIQAQQQRPGET